MHVKQPGRGKWLSSSVPPHRGFQPLTAHPQGLLVFHAILENEKNLGTRLHPFQISTKTVSNTRVVSKQRLVKDRYDLKLYFIWFIFTANIAFS